MKAKLTYPVKKGWARRRWIGFLRRQADCVEQEAKRWATPKAKKTRLEIARVLRADADAIEAGLKEGA